MYDLLIVQWTNRQRENQNDQEHPVQNEPQLEIEEDFLSKSTTLSKTTHWNWEGLYTYYYRTASDQSWTEIKGLVGYQVLSESSDFLTRARLRRSWIQISIRSFEGRLPATLMTNSKNNNEMGDDGSRNGLTITAQVQKVNISFRRRHLLPGIVQEE